jgi:hypothetical protein
LRLILKQVMMQLSSKSVGTAMGWQIEADNHTH